MMPCGKLCGFLMGARDKVALGPHNRLNTPVRAWGARRGLQPIHLAGPLHPRFMTLLGPVWAFARTVFASEHGEWSVPRWASPGRTGCTWETGQGSREAARCQRPRMASTYLKGQSSGGGNRALVMAEH